MTKRSTSVERVIVGLDLGDRSSGACAIEQGSGSVVREWRLPTTQRALARHFEHQPAMRIALEVGTHSPWVSRLLASWGHEVFVANPRKVRLIAHSRRKSDRFDSQTLARLARLDAELLSPVRHRSAECQHELAVLRARAALVRARTLLVNHLRGAVKAAGERLPACSTAALSRSHLPESLVETLGPVLDVLAGLSDRIGEYDRQIERLGKRRPEVAVLRQVAGVGPLTSLAFVLTLEDPARFARSRDVGAYLGFTPARRQSGASDPQMRITKEGDPFLRQLMVQSAHYILGPFGPDTDLRRFGHKLAERGGQAAKKRAVIAVARKLSVVLHRLWVTQERYEALRSVQRVAG